MCRRKHRTPGDLVSVHCARPATGVASVRWDKDILASQTLPNPDDTGPIVHVRLRQSLGSNPESLVAHLVLRWSALDHCATRKVSLSMLLKHLWQRLQSCVYLGMMLQAWHTCIWRVSPIPLCRYSQALSGWMGSVDAQLFTCLSRDVRSGSKLGSGWATQGHSETCPEATPCCLGCVLRIVFLLEGEPSPQTEVLE
jgi:hypothetical protein